MIAIQFRSCADLAQLAIIIIRPPIGGAYHAYYKLSWVSLRSLTVAVSQTRMSRKQRPVLVETDANEIPNVSEAVHS